MGALAAMTCAHAHVRLPACLQVVSQDRTATNTYTVQVYVVPPQPAPLCNLQLTGASEPEPPAGV